MTDATTPKDRYTIADLLTFTNSIPLGRSQNCCCPAAACTIARELDTCDKRESKRIVPQVRSPWIISGRNSRTSVKEKAGGKLPEAICYNNRRQLLHTNFAIMRLGLPQSFLESPLHYSSPKQQADQINHDLKRGTRGCDCCCRCGRSGDRRSDGVKVVRKSRSHSPLRTSVSELSGWTSQPISTARIAKPAETRVNGPGEARLERLPVEILGRLPFERHYYNDLTVACRQNHCTTFSRYSTSGVCSTECRPDFLPSYFSNVICCYRLGAL